MSRLLRVLSSLLLLGMFASSCSVGVLQKAASAADQPSSPATPDSVASVPNAAAPTPTTLAPPTAPTTQPSPRPPAPTALEPPDPWTAEFTEWIAGSIGPDLDLSVSIGSDRRGIVLEHNPNLELWPASNQKILTAIGAYELLPDDHRFTTTVGSDGVVDGAVLRGDLVFVASGDPTLTSAGLVSLAQQVRAGGIERVDGDLVIDAGRYESATTALGWQDWQVPTYVGPMSAFVVDDNRWRTDAAYVADPALGNAARFNDVLAAAGVQVSGVVRPGADPGDSSMVSHLSSAPIAELLTRMLRTSDNEIAESIVREIGYIEAANGSTAAGLAAIRNALAAQGFALSGRDGDGSGLSRANYRSATGWRELLAYAESAPWADAFVDALPVSGVSGTLAGRLNDPATIGNVSAKTGTIIGGRALSGYATLPDGDTVMFSIIANGDGAGDARQLIDQIVTRLINDPPG